MGFADFPPFPPSFRGRSRETRVLASLVKSQHPSAIALIGAGGSGKTTLAAAVGHRVRTFFGGRLLWLRIGPWDRWTVAELMASQLRAFGDGPPIRRIRRALAQPTLVVLDNHEDDAVTANILGSLHGLPVTWIITARRCLLGGVTIFPIVPALIETREIPFPAIARLTRLLRWHPVALDMANALVTAGLASETTLERRLVARGVGRIVPIAHEDDVPEVAALVVEALRYISASSKRMLAVLASMGGDSMDEASLATLARSRLAALARLVELRLVQSPAKGRYTVHATVRQALRKTARFDMKRYARHYLDLLEQDASRIFQEQTHLFALMDWAHESHDLGLSVKVQNLAHRLDELQRSGEDAGS